MIFIVLSGKVVEAEVVMTLKAEHIEMVVRDSIELRAAGF